MSSRSLRRSVAILGFAALLLPAASLQAQSRHLPPATQTAPRHHSVIEFLLNLISGGIGSRIDAGCPIDGNG